MDACEIKIDALETDQCSAINESEYFLGGSNADCESAEVGSGIPLDATDGLYNSLVEDVLKNNVGATDGSITVHVRGKDVLGNWGVCETVGINLDCLPPDYPTCELGNENPNIDNPNGILLNDVCNPNELLVCGNDPILYANVCDSQSTIQLAEYFLDDDTPINWEGTEMTASDGDYLDEQCEDVEALIDLTELSDGTHYIQLHAKDEQENWGKLNQPANPLVSFIKDTTSPKTEKEIVFADGQSWECDAGSFASILPEGVGVEDITKGCYYVKSGTEVTLSALDFNPDDNANGGFNNLPGEYADNVKINYRTWYKENDTSEWQVSPTIMGLINESVMITLEEDSYHLIEYWATDLCTNEEMHQFELDIVDNKPPVVEKTVGGPSVACSELGQQDCDYYITQQTPITLNCTDQEPHPIDKVVLYWRDYLEVNEPSQWIVEEDGHAEITKNEDSRHILEWYCEDALGNSAGSAEEPFQEIDVVESVPPVIEKEVIGPQFGQCPPEPYYDTFNGNGYDYCFVDNMTIINVNAIDPEPHPVNDVMCDWWYEVYPDYYYDGPPTFGGGEDGVIPPFNITFPEESMHHLWIECWDALGNYVEDHEVFIADHTPPVTEKIYDGPQYSDGIYYFQTTLSQNISVVVEGDANQVTWTIDFPLESPYNEIVEGNGLMGVGLIIATDGESNGPAFQIHNNDGTDAGFDWGTWLYSPWGPTISDGWFGWHSSSNNTLVTDFDWVSASGERYNENNSDGLFTITIDRSELGENFHWALHTAIGSGFNSDYLTYQLETYPNNFGWATPIVSSTNYEYAESVEGYPKWITTDTLVILNANDQEPHPSGVNMTFWRNTIVPDENCWDQELCQLAEGKDEWNVWNEPFRKEKESCHLIEYYSVDNVNKTETVKKQCVFVDTTHPLTDKEVGEPRFACDGDVEECGPEGTWPAWYVNSSTPITLSCADQEPHPVDHSELCFAVSWHISEGMCNDYRGEWTGEFCYITGAYAQDGGEFNDGYYCVDLENEEFEFHFEEDSLHNLEWFCEDALGNRGELNVEWDNVDNQPPEIIVHNPTGDEAGNITRCTQGIVAEIWDLKSGVNESSVYAELHYENGTAVPDHKVQLTKAVYPSNEGLSIFEGLMDKELPAGLYTLNVCASDNLGNEYCKPINEVLQDIIFVEFIHPSACTVNPEQGGECEFTFNVCMRGDNGLKFWLDKLGGIVTPAMMNATIVDPDDLDDAFVGLRHDGFISEAEFLQLGLDCTDINGQEQFDLNLNITSQVAQSIGPGIHDLDYWMETFLEPNCPLPLE